MQMATTTTMAPGKTANRQQGATTGDIAERFRVCEESVRRWARSGRIPAYRAGTVYRFDLDAVEDALRLRAGHHHG